MQRNNLTDLFQKKQKTDTPSNLRPLDILRINSENSLKHKLSAQTSQTSKQTSSPIDLTMTSDDHTSVLINEPSSTLGRSKTKCLTSPNQKTKEVDSQAQKIKEQEQKIKQVERNIEELKANHMLSLSQEMHKRLDAEKKCEEYEEKIAALNDELEKHQKQIEQHQKQIKEISEGMNFYKEKYNYSRSKIRKLENENQNINENTTTPLQKDNIALQNDITLFQQYMRIAVQSNSIFNELKKLSDYTRNKYPDVYAQIFEILALTTSNSMNTNSIPVIETNTMQVNSLNLFSEDNISTDGESVSFSTPNILSTPDLSSLNNEEIIKNLTNDSSDLMTNKEQCLTPLTSSIEINSENNSGKKSQAGSIWGSLAPFWMQHNQQNQTFGIPSPADLNRDDPNNCLKGKSP